MKTHRKYIAAIVIAAMALVGWADAQAQTATRATPCSPTTAWNAVCINFTPPTTYTDGTPIASGTVLTYRVEDRLETTGTWTTVPSTLVGTRDLHVQNLLPGIHYVRVFTTASGVESAASNVANKGVTTGVPNPAIITIAVVISEDSAPVYRVLSTGKRGEFFGMVPVGQSCIGPVLFRYRNTSFREVRVVKENLWGTQDVSAKYAAPCA